MIVFPSCVALDFARLYAMMWYNFLMSSMFSSPSLLPRYFEDSESNNICFTAACQPNIRKKGASFDDCIGKKLYAEVALGITLSHSSPF